MEWSSSLPKKGQCLPGLGWGGGEDAFTFPGPSVDPEEGSWWWVISEGILHKRAACTKVSGA